MKVLKAGHIYELDTLDGDFAPLVFTFVCREAPLGRHSGVQTQEVLRMLVDVLEYDAQLVSELQEMLIDRTNHCDGCEPWVGNERIIKALSESARQARLALLYHEQRVMERRFAKGKFDPAAEPVGEDGHYTALPGADVPTLTTEYGDDGVQGFPNAKERRISQKDRRHLGLTSRSLDRPLVERGAQRRRGTFHPDHGWNRLGNLKIP